MSRLAAPHVFLQMICSLGVVALIWGDYWDLSEERLPVGGGHGMVVHADSFFKASKNECFSKQIAWTISLIRISFS